MNKRFPLSALDLLKSALQAMPVQRGFRASTIYDVDCCSVRVNADHTSDPASDTLQLLEELVFPFSVSQLQRRVRTPRLVTRRGREPNAVANHFGPGSQWQMHVKGCDLESLRHRVVATVNQGLEGEALWQQNRLTLEPTTASTLSPASINVRRRFSRTELSTTLCRSNSKSLCAWR